MKHFKFNSDEPNFPLVIQLELRHGDITALVLPHHMFIRTPQNAVNRAMTHRLVTPDYACHLYLDDENNYSGSW